MWRIAWILYTRRRWCSGPWIPLAALGPWSSAIYGVRNRMDYIVIYCSILGWWRFMYTSVLFIPERLNCQSMFFCWNDLTHHVPTCHISEGMWRSCHSGCSSSHTTHVRRSSWQVSFHCHHEVYTQCAGEIHDYDYMFDSTIWLTLLYVIIAIHFTKACWCDSQGLSYPCHQRRGRCSRARTRVKVRRMTALGPPEARLIQRFLSWHGRW